MSDGEINLPFSEFAINPGRAVSTHLNFAPVRKHGFNVATWTEGRYDLELWVKYSGADHPKKQREDSIAISIDDRAALQSREPRNIRFSSIDDYLDAI